MKRLRITLLGLIVIPVLVFGGGAGGTQQQQTQALTVCSEGSPVCTFAKIQAAIDAANPNDFVFIQPGRYEENLTINKSLRLVGTEAGQVLIQGVTPGQATVTLRTEEASRFSLQSLTIIGGPAVNATPENPITCLFPAASCPPGILVEGIKSLVLTVVDVQFIGGPIGTGMSCFAEEPVQGFARVFVLRSQITHMGFGGIVWGCDFQEATLHLEEVTFSDNKISGLAILRDETSPIVVTVERSKFIRNDRGIDAGGSGIVLTVKDSWFIDNAVAGVIMSFITANNSAQIQESFFVGNEVGLAWEGITGLSGPEGASGMVEDSFFIGNELAGVFVRSVEKLDVRRNMISENGSGVIISFSSAGFALNENRIIGNREWGVTLRRPECVENGFNDPVGVQGEGNEIHNNGKGDLCPENFNWPPDFIKKP